MASLPPIAKQLEVPLPVAHAFALFTESISRWWPFATHSCFRGEALRIEFAPRAGGRVIEHSRDGRTADWGRVTLWDPPQRFAMTWHPAGTPADATHLEVAFAETGLGRTAISLRHSGWDGLGAAAAGKHANYTEGWD